MHIKWYDGWLIYTAIYLTLDDNQEIGRNGVNRN